MEVRVLLMWRWFRTWFAAGCCRGILTVVFWHFTVCGQESAWSVKHETITNLRDVGSMENWIWTLGTNQIAIRAFPRWDMKELRSKRELEVFDRSQSFRILLRSHGLADVPESRDWVAFLLERHPEFRLLSTPLDQPSGYGAVTVMDFVRAKEGERLRRTSVAYRVAIIPVGDRFVECGIQSALSNLLDPSGEPTTLSRDFGRFLLGLRPMRVLEESKIGTAAGK
jgi:hypothetical protein